MEAKATKVGKVQPHQTSYNKEVQVTEGKLILIHNPNISPEIGMLGWEKSKGYFICKEYKDQILSDVVSPVIISETEEIEAGDLFLCKNGSIDKLKGFNLNVIEDKKDLYKNNTKECYNIHGEKYIIFPESFIGKILSLPESFSPKHLKAIVDGKLKDGDKVIIECEAIPNEYDNPFTNPEGIWHPDSEFEIKLNEKNYITIHPKKEAKTFTEEEVIGIIQKLMHQVFEADEKIVYSEKKIDFKLSPKKWFEEYVRKYLPILLLPILLLFGFKPMHAQNSQSRIDSLISCLKTATSDTTRVNILNELAYYEWNYNNSTDEALKYAIEAQKLSEEIEYQHGLAMAHRRIGITYTGLDYAMALEHLIKSLQINESLKNNEEIFLLNGDLGIVYYNQKSLSIALSYFLKSLQFRKDDSFTLKWIGIIHLEQGNYSLSLDFLKRAYTFSEDSRSKSGILLTIGTVFERDKYKKDNLDSALFFYSEALKLCKDDQNCCDALGSIGDLFFLKHNFDSSIFYQTKSLELAYRLNYLSSIAQTTKALSSLYETIGNDKKSLEFFRKNVEANSKLFNEEQTKRITKTEMNYQFDKNRAIEKTIHGEEIKRISIIRNSFILGFILVLCFSTFLFRLFKKTQKQKEIISQQKIWVENERQQTLDNITYSKRIQDAVMPPLSKVKELLPNSFIYNSPRDIISGDFFFVEKIDENKILFIVADCTNHSVSGCLMSILCINLLHEAINKGNKHSADIINYVNIAMAKSFHQSEGEKQIKDTMDCSVCILNTDTLELEFSGAYNPAIIIRGNEIIELDANKFPIGDTNELYNNEYLQLEKNDRIFLSSDGYSDQFGLINGKEKKLKYKNFLNILKNCNNKNMEETKIIVEESFKNYKGEISQTDDVLVMGVKI